MHHPDYSDYTIKWATLPWEVDQAYALRRQVFCAEQHLFETDDHDAVDDRARTLVALGNHGGWHQEVVGTVRIHCEGERLWYGSRLAVSPQFRSQGQLGSTLIRLAVSSAHALDCSTFLATVQVQNEALFQRLNWQTIEYREIHGMKHALMQADLSAYPPCYTPQSGFVVKARNPYRHTGIWGGLLDSSWQQHKVAAL